MKLTSMKLAPKKKENTADKCCAPVCCDDKDEFPYGLQINLETEQIKKLGGMGDFDIDEKVTIQAIGSITKIETEKRQNGEDRNSVRIQIESIAISSNSAFEKGFDEATKKK